MENQNDTFFTRTYSKSKKNTLEHDLLTYEILNCINLKKIVDWAKFLEIR